MALSVEDVIRIGNLARLSLTPDEVVELTTKLGQIVGLVEQLAEVDTENVEPMVHAFDLQNVLAADIRKPSLSRDEEIGRAHV